MEAKDLLDGLQEEWRRERPDLDVSAMGIVGRVIVLGELLKKRAEEALQDCEIGYTDLDVLATLRRSGEPYELRPSRLLKTVLIQSGSLTACLDRLESRGLVERVPIPNDRRGRSVRLTLAGLSLVDRAIVARFKDASESVSCFNAEESAALAELLRRLLTEHSHSS